MTRPSRRDLMLLTPTAAGAAVALVAGVLSPLVPTAVRVVLLVVAGLLVAVGLGFHTLRLLRAVAPSTVDRFWVQLRWSALLVVAVGCWTWAREPSVLAAVVAVVSTVLVVGSCYLARRLPVVVEGELQANALPGATDGPAARPRWPHGWVGVATVGYAVLVFVLAVFAVPVWFTLVLAVLATAVILAITRTHAALAERTDQVRRALTAYAPAYVMPYNGTAGFHVSMWTPYLGRTGLPGVLVTTHDLAFTRLIRDYPEMPTIYGPTGAPAAVKAMFAPSVKAAFYVHNGQTEAFLEVRRATHVFIHHGDSDKDACSKAKTAQYDNLVVAGQAAVDRYAMRGVKMPKKKFRILGRPQIEQIASVDHPISSVEHPVVMYAPTWHREGPKDPYSSLLKGPTIVEALLARGCTVIFRPHPASRHLAHVKTAIKTVNDRLAADAQETGRAHRWGKAADEPRLSDLINEVDAMVADVSGVVTDFMQSLKPFTMMSAKHGVRVFREKFPSSQGAYVVRPDLSNLDEALDHMLGDDPLAEKRVERRAYYLGGYENDESAQAFVRYARELAGVS